jgi:hypothetical protein
VRSRTRCICVALIFPLFSAHSPRGEENALPLRAATQPSTAPAYIGIYWMEDDGTIVMDLRVKGPGRISGQSILTYPPHHPEYQSILDHVGPLKAGETKSVRPWSD